MVSYLILLRSLRVYILKQLFFSISVSISVFGLRNIYLAASQLGKYIVTIHPNLSYVTLNCIML